MPDEREEIEQPRFLRLSPENRKKMWKRAKIAIYALVSLLVLIFLFGGEFGMFALYRYDRYKKIYEKQVAIEQVRQDSLSTVLLKLKTDPEYLERLAREKLRMVKDGERIYRFK